jgi:hypothetical protein
VPASLCNDLGVATEQRLHRVARCSQCRETSATWEGNAQASNVRIVVAGDAAWLVYDFIFTAKLADGKPFVAGWESHRLRGS